MSTSFLGACALFESLFGETAPNQQQKVFEEKSDVSVEKPYKREGILHVPEEQPDYDVIGMPVPLESQGISQNAQDIAGHPTLPLPSLVEVTNLNNGYSVLLKVNQRGAYGINQVIALSPKVAQMLEISQDWKETFVRVRYLQRLKPHSPSPEPFVNKRNQDKLNDVIAPLSYFPHILKKEARAAREPSVLNDAFSSPDYYLQSEIFSLLKQAERALEDLKDVPQSHITQSHGRYFVRIGPFDNLETIAKMTEQVRRRGYKKIQIIKKQNIDADRFLKILSKKQ